MFVAIHAYECVFCGLHGIEEHVVVEVDNFQQAEEWASDLAYGVVEDYSYHFDEEDIDDPELAWEIYEIPDPKGKSASELSDEYWNDPEEFLEKYKCVQIG